MRVRLVVAAVMVAQSAAAGPATMSVRDFLVRADALQARGPLALFSRDYGVLKALVVDAGDRWRAQAATAAPRVCAPAGASLSRDGVLAILRAVPLSDRPATDTQAALIHAMNLRYRCP